MKKKLLLVLVTLFLTFPAFTQAGLLGDANESGTIDIVDALVVAQHYVGLAPAHINTSLADTNGDGSVGIVDALLIAQYFVGLISQFPGQGQAVEILKSAAPRNTSPELDSGELSELVSGNTAFAIDIYKKAASGPGNIIMSPYSISVAFGMTYAGARSTTDTEIANVLHFTLGQSRLHNAFNALDLELLKPGSVSPSSTGQQFTLRFANSIWGQKGFSFVPAFLDTLAINYNAGLNILDFAANPEGSRITINTWVSDQTEQKINDLLAPGTISTQTALVLTNAIYFKASWNLKFNPSQTTPQTFTLLDGSTSSVQMMKQVSSNKAAEVAGEYQAVSMLYYGSRYSMVFIVPDQGKYAEFESSLSVSGVASILGSLADRTVTFSVPKFSYEWSDSLKAMLQSLGMNVPFGSGADFSGITTAAQLFIGDAVHKAFIGVNEEGTEAAAATAVLLPTSAPPQLTVTINRPFMYLIRENTTNTILFIGRVTKP